MDLTGIISISGKPGLFKVIAQGKNSIIVESLVDGKRIPAYASDRISALDDISIYTYESDKPLKEVFADLHEKTAGKEGPSHKEDISTLQNYLSDILPDYDEERVYPSDIKKLFQWYNLLLKADVFKPAKEEKAEEKKETKKPSAKKETTSKASGKSDAPKKPKAKKEGEKAPAKEKKKTEK